MKEIKFRAWDRTEKKIYKDVVGIRFYPGCIDVTIRDEGGFAEMQDVNLIALTGLKDKNAKEICDGDIIKTQRGNIGLVRHSLSVCWHLKYRHQTDNSEKIIQLWEILHDMEIIGNIYENPELLEKPLEKPSET